jgi:hypothetical protein
LWLNLRSCFEIEALRARVTYRALSDVKLQMKSNGNGPRLKSRERQHTAGQPLASDISGKNPNWQLTASSTLNMPRDQARLKSYLL